jgi:hypothetical protein
MLLITLLVQSLEDGSFQSNNWNTGGIIGGIITAIGTLFWSIRWIGDYFSKQNENRLSLDLKKMELEDKQEEQKIKELIDKVKSLQTEVEGLEKTLRQERSLRAKAEQQLQSINTAFDVVYLALEDLLGEDPKGKKILEVLGKHIKNGPGNTTPQG